LGGTEHTVNEGKGGRPAHGSGFQECKLKKTRGQKGSISRKNQTEGVQGRGGGRVQFDTKSPQIRVVWKKKNLGAGRRKHVATFDKKRKKS